LVVDHHVAVAAQRTLARIPSRRGVLPPGLVDHDVATDAATPLRAADRVEARHGRGLGEHEREVAGLRHPTELDAATAPAAGVVVGALSQFLERRHRRVDATAGLDGVGDGAPYADAVLGELLPALQGLLGEAVTLGHPADPDPVADIPGAHA